MKNLFFSMLLLVVSCNLSFGQGGVNVEWGKSFDASTEVQKIIGQQEDIMYVYSKKGKKTFLQAFKGENQELKFNQEFKLPEYNGKKTTIIDMVMTNNGPMAISYQKNKKTGAVKVYAQNFSLSGRIQGKGIVIMETSDPVKMKDPDVFIQQSRDKSKLMFAYMRHEKKEPLYHVDVVVFDQDLNVLSQRDEAHDFSESKGEDRYFNVEVHLDNDGSYLTSVELAVYRKKTTPEYSFTIKDYNAEGELEGEKTVKFDEKGIYKPYIFFDEKENTFRVVGMYAEFRGNKSYMPGYSGVYNAVIERGSLDVIEKHVTPFSEEFLKNFYRAKKIEKAANKDKNLYVSSGFGIDHVYLTAEGNLVVTAEYYTKVWHDADSGPDYTQWTYGDVIVMSVNNEGGLNWINVVPKMQVTSVPDLPLMVGLLAVSIKLPDPQVLNNWSYVPGIGSDHLYLVFNDHIKNAIKADDKQKPVVNPKKSIPYKVSIDLETGEFVKKPMVNATDADTYMAPQVIYRLSDNKYIIWAVKRKENKFGTVTFE